MKKPQNKFPPTLDRITNQKFSRQINNGSKVKIRNYSKETKNFLGLPEDLKLLSRHPSLERFFGKKLKTLFIKKNEPKVITSSYTNTFENNKPNTTIIKPTTPKTKKEFDTKVQDRIVPTLGKKEIKNTKHKYLTKNKNGKTTRNRYLDELTQQQVTNNILNEDEFNKLKNFQLKIKEKKNSNNISKKNEAKVMTSSHTNTFENNKPNPTIIKPTTPKTKEEFDTKVIEEEDTIVPTLGKKEIKNTKYKYLTKNKNGKTTRHRYLDELIQEQEVTNHIFNEDEFNQLKNFQLIIKEKKISNNISKEQVTPLQLKPKRNLPIDKMMKLEKRDTSDYFGNREEWSDLDARFKKYNSKAIAQLELKKLEKIRQMKTKPAENIKENVLLIKDTRKINSNILSPRPRSIITSNNYNNLNDSKASSFSRKIDNQISKQKISMKNQSDRILKFQNKNKDLEIQMNKETKDRKSPTYPIRKYLASLSPPKLRPAMKEKAKEIQEPPVVKQKIVMENQSDPILEFQDKNKDLDIKIQDPLLVKQKIMKNQSDPILQFQNKKKDLGIQMNKEMKARKSPTYPIRKLVSKSAPKLRATINKKAKEIQEPLEVNQKIFMKNQSDRILEFQNKNKDFDIQMNKEMKARKSPTNPIRNYLGSKSAPKLRATIKEKDKEIQEPLVVNQKIMKNQSDRILEFQNKNKDLDIQMNKEMKDRKSPTYPVRKYLVSKSSPKLRATTKEKTKEIQEPLVVKQDWIYPLKTTNPHKLKMDQLNESIKKIPVGFNETIKKIPIGGGEKFFDHRKNLSMHRFYKPSKICQTSMHSNSSLEIPFTSTELRLEDKLNKIIEWLEQDNLLRRKIAEPIERLLISDEVSGEIRKKPRIWQLIQKLRRITNSEEKSYTGSENRTISTSTNNSNLKSGCTVTTSSADALNSCQERSPRGAYFSIPTSSPKGPLPLFRNYHSMASNREAITQECKPSNMQTQNTHIEKDKFEYADSERMALNCLYSIDYLKRVNNYSFVLVNYLISKLLPTSVNGNILPYSFEKQLKNFSTMNDSAENQYKRKKEERKKLKQLNLKHKRLEASLVPIKSTLKVKTLEDNKKYIETMIKRVYTNTLNKKPYKYVKAEDKSILKEWYEMYHSRINGETIQGRANIAKLTLASFALFILYRKMNRPLPPAPPPSPNQSSNQKPPSEPPEPEDPPPPPPSSITLTKCSPSSNPKNELVELEFPDHNEYYKIFPDFPREFY